jgi:UDP-3-O-[3-hydroxymyristoyl] glucosamine N-acyltransferase
MDEVTKKRYEFAKSLTGFRPTDNFHHSVIIGKHCSIGGDGFGWIRLDDGSLYKMPHCGRVIIEENVVIANNVNIDRGVIKDTILRKGCKIDSLVHIAHNCEIGENTLIVAGSVIGGSCKIGKRCFIGMNASIKNKITIGDDAIIGAGAVILNDVPNGQTWIGNPGRQLIK